VVKINALNRQQAIAGFGVIACCGLLMLAVPRFIASLYALYPEAAFKQNDTKLPVDVYQKSIDHLTQALSWYEDPEYWQTQAFFYLELFNASTQPLAQKQELLKQAQVAITQGLKLSPIDPYAWFRLATVGRALKIPAPQIINALQLSFYAGRVEPGLSMSRLSFAYDYYHEFNEEMRSLWQKQIPIAWAFQSERLVKFVASHLETKVLVEEALANSPDNRKKFSVDLESYIQKNP